MQGVVSVCVLRKKSSTSSVHSFTFRDGQVSIVCHRRLFTVYSASLVRGYSRSLPIHPLIPEDELQHQLPTETHIASSLALLSLTNLSTSGCSGNLRFCRKPNCDEELHSIFVSLQVKITSSLAVWARLCISRRVLECCYMAKAFFYFLPAVLCSYLSVETQCVVLIASLLLPIANPSRKFKKGEHSIIQEKVFVCFQYLFVGPRARRWRGASVGAKSLR